MKNYSQILRINGFEKFFANNEVHLRMADQSSVETALALCADDRSWHNLNGTRGFSRDKSLYLKGRIPKSVYWGGLFQKLKINEMDAKERDAMDSAFYKVYSKFKSTNGGR